MLFFCLLRIWVQLCVYFVFVYFGYIDESCLAVYLLLFLLRILLYFSSFFSSFNFIFYFCPYLGLDAVLLFLSNLLRAWKFVFFFLFIFCGNFKEDTLFWASLQGMKNPIQVLKPIRYNVTFWNAHSSPINSALFIVIHSRYVVCT